MYTYYIKVESDEHMLFTNEIALHYEIYSLSYTPHTKLISKAIKKIISQADDPNLVGSIFYKTKTNMKQVYPYSIYSKAIEYIKDNSIDDGDNKYIVIDNTTFRYKSI